jgi:hypothetical protein
MTFAPSRVCLALLLLALLIFGAITGQPVDTGAAGAAAQAERPQRATGTGSVYGRIVDSVGAAPLEHATVTLVRHTGQSLGQMLVAGNVSVNFGPGDEYRTITTNGRGQFAFFELPAGHYTLSTEFDGWVTLPYDSTSNDHGVSVELTENQRANVTIRMSAFPTISGRVFDDQGSPMAGATISISRWGVEAGRRQLQRVTWIVADGRGEYTGSVPPGEYLVSASSDEVRIATWSSPLPPMSGFRRVFYPFARDAAGAEPIRVAPGQHRGDVDVQLRAEPMVRLFGGLRDSSGTGVLPKSVALSTRDESESRRGASVDASGRFMFDKLFPGEYLVDGASSYDNVSRPATKTWVGAVVNVGTRDSEVTLDVHRDYMIRGRVVFDGDDPPPAGLLGQIGLFMLPPDVEGIGDVIPAHPVVQTDGTFTMELTAGRYLATVEIGYEFSLSDRPSDAALAALRRWTPASMIWNGRDILTTPLDLTADISDVVLTLRRSHPQGAVRGRVIGSRALVVLIPADPSQWVDFGAGRNLRVARTGDGGAYRITAPAGDYFVAAVRGIRESDWRSADLFAAVLPFATRISLAGDATVSAELHAIDAPSLTTLPSPPPLPAAFDVITAQAASSIVPPIRPGAVLAGRVIAADSGQPLSRVRVGTYRIVRSSRFNDPNDVFTDDTGRFVLSDVSPGTKSLFAARSGWALVPDRGSRMPLQLAATERVEDVVVVMTPTATITGTIQDDRGRTVEGAEVQVWSPPRSERAGLTDTGFRGRTDSVGRYRIEGLSGGRYYVSATGERAGSSGDEHVTTQEDVDYAAGVVARPPLSIEPRGWAHMPVFYPGTSEAASAQAVIVASGDVREIDFTLRQVDLRTVSGTVRMPSGTPPRAFSVRLMPVEREMVTLGVLPFTESAREGEFRVANVTPGRYLLSARVIDGLSTALEGVAGYLDVLVGDADEKDVVMELRPGATITGRVTIDGGPPAPGSELIVRAAAIRTPIDFSYGGTQAAIGDDGRFTLMNVVPGTYQMTVQVKQRSSPHTIVSQRVSGEETLDTGFDVAPAQQIRDVELAVASAPAALSGVVREANRSPARNAIIMLFPATANAWELKSPRMLSVQTNQSGGYEFNRVPPGEYLVAAADLAPDEWSTDTIREHLANAPKPAHLLSGGSYTLDLADVP